MNFFKTLSKRGLALFLVLTMCLSLLPTTAYAAEADTPPVTAAELGADTQEFSGGSGTADDPYLISSAGGLRYLAQVINSTDTAKYHEKYFALTADIDLGGAELTPIGSDVNHCFWGTFYGGGHTISNFTVTGDVAGLFGWVVYSKFYNLTIKNATVTATGQNCAAGALIAVDYCGGNWSYSTDLENCHVVDSTVTASGTYSNAAYMPCAGGLVGTASRKLNISKCTVENPQISSSHIAGGVVGSMTINRCTIAISDTACTGGSVSSTSRTGYAGGIVGSAANWVRGYNDSNSVIGCFTFSISNCLNTASITTGVTGSSSRSGGILGYFYTGTATVSNCASLGTVSKGSNAAIGYSYPTIKTTTCYTDTATAITKLPSSWDKTGEVPLPAKCSGCEGCTVQKETPGGDKPLAVTFRVKNGQWDAPSLKERTQDYTYPIVDGKLPAGTVPPTPMKSNTPGKWYGLRGNEVSEFTLEEILSAAYTQAAVFIYAYPQETHTVTFDFRDGSDLVYLAVADGEPIPADMVPSTADHTENGKYSFQYWEYITGTLDAPRTEDGNLVEYCVAADYARWNMATGITADTVLYAYWGSSLWYAQFVTSGGYDVPSQRFADPDTVTKPVVAGKRLSGWSYAFYTTLDPFDTSQTLVVPHEWYFGEMTTRKTTDGDSLWAYIVRVSYFMDPIDENNVIRLYGPGQTTPCDPAPSLTVTKTVDNSEPNPNDNVVYTITVKNTGEADAEGVVVTDVLPEGLTFVSWKLNDGTESTVQPEGGRYTIGTLSKKNGTVALTITAAVGDTVAAGTEIKNTAAADYTGKPEGTDPKGEVTVTVAAKPELTGITKELVSVTVGDQTTDMTAGDAQMPEVVKDAVVTLRYKITITGTSGAQYTVTDPDAVPEDGGDALSGTLGESGKAEIYVTKTVNTSEAGSQTVKNTAYVKPEGGTAPITPSSPEQDPTNPEKGYPSNAVETEIVVSDPEAGKYSVTYSWGKIGVTDVETVTLPSGIVKPEPCSYEEGATVTVDTSVTSAVKAQVGEALYIFAGWKTDDAQVDADGQFTMPAKDVTLSARWTKVDYSIGVTKQITAVTNAGGTTQIGEGQAVRVDHGDEVTYEVTVTNTSNQTLYALRIDDVMDPGLTLIAGTAAAAVTGNGDNKTVNYLGTTVDTDGAETSAGETAYYWELPGSFAPGAKVTLTYQALVNMDAEHIIVDAYENVRLNNTVYASAFKQPQAAPAPASAPSETLGLEVISYSIVSYSRGDVSGSASAGAGSAGASASGKRTYAVEYSWGTINGTPVTPAGAGLPAAVRYEKGVTVTVDTSANAVTAAIGEGENQETYTFSGWTTSDAKVTDGQFTMPGQKVLLTAQWEKDTGNPDTGKWTVTYKTEAGEVIGTPDEVEKGQSIKIKNGPAAPEGKEFAGWSEDPASDNPVIVKPGDSFTPGKDTTFYPVWKDKDPDPITPDPNPKTVTVTWYDESRATVLDTADWTEGTAEPAYSKAAPVKAEDASYTYTFAGWIDRLVDAEGNVSYKAHFDRTPKAPTPSCFTVTWLDELAPGEPVKTQSVTSLREAVYPAHPYHPGYEGNGWSEPVRDASGNYTITARYVELHVDPQAPDFLYLRDVLHITVEVVCDTHATHAPVVYEVPLKEYSYGSAVAGDRCTITIAPDAYVAEYIGGHSIVGVAPQTIELVYVAGAAEPAALVEEPIEPAGEEAPAAEAEIPAEEEPIISEESPAPVEESAGDAIETGTEEAAEEETVKLSVISDAALEGCWTFADGSEPRVTFHVRCEEPAPETYTVTWLDDDGSLLDRQTGETGQPEPAYGGTAPSKPGCTFTGWSDPVTDADGNVTYVAQYEPIVPAGTYTVTWLDDDGSLLDRQTGETGQPEPAYGGTAPSKPGCTFIGWSDPVTDADGNVTYVAQYEPIVPAGTYTVTWLDDDGSLLDRQTGETGQPEPAYGGTVPSKPGCTFTGWSDPVTDADGNVTYVAQYEPVPETPAETHTVTWVNWNGMQLQQAVVNNGAAEPGYTGTTPVRPNDGVYYYTFTGWSAPAVDAGGNVTYTAQYTAALIYNPGTPSYPSTPSTPGAGTGTGTGTPATTIPDSNTPLAGSSTDDGSTTIADQDVPLDGAVGLNNANHFAYIIGYDDGTVRPLNNITRAEAATIFFRLMTDEYRSANWATSNAFSDVAAGNWFNNAVSTCANAGALAGYADGSFRPNANITRAEFAAIAARFLSDEIIDDGTGDFADTANHWAAREIRLAAKAGWIQGDGNNFRPNDYITRAEVMTIVNRMLERVPDKDHMLDTMKTWIDNPKGTWYYEAVQEATNEHAYERDELGVVETWTEILKERDWAALEAEWAAANAR